MITIHEKYMEEEEFEKAKQSITDHWTKVFPNATIEIEFEPTCMAGECNPNIHIFVDGKHFDEATNHKWDSNEHKKFMEELEEKYGNVSCMVNKILDEGKTEAEIGDFLLIDDGYSYDGKDNVVVVSSIIEQDGHKLYGASHIVIDFERICVSHDNPISITNGKYGGYIKGFSRILSLRESIEMLTKNSNIDYQQYLKTLKAEKKDVDKSIIRFVSEMSKKEFKIRNVKRMALDDFDCCLVKTQAFWNSNS